MIKVCTALPRRSDLTRAQFQQHWGTVHRDLAIRIDRISRYVQSHPRPVDLPGLPTAAFDGFPEVWFPDLDSALALGGDPQYVDGAHADEPRFIDVDRMVRTWVTPHLLRRWGDFADAAGSAKIILLAAAPATDSAREGLADAADLLAPRRLLIGTALADSRVRNRQAFGQIVELWWGDDETAIDAWRTGVDDFLRRAQPFLDRTTSAVTLVREERVRWPGDLTEQDMRA